ASKAGVGASFSFSFDKETTPPKGIVNLDSTSGLFTYIPDPADLRAFAVTVVVSRAGQQIDRQVVDIEPLPVLPAEETFLSTGHGLPDPESIHYIVSNVATNQAVTFNDVVRPTLDIIVSGKRVPIRNGHTDSLALLDGVKNLSSLRIYAETV